MDSVFGIGLPEFVLLIVLAAMVMGPERIVRYARTLGATLARMQAVSRAFLRQLNAELDSSDTSGELRETLDELQLLRRQVADLRAEVFTIAGGTMAEGKQVVGELKEAEKAIIPPSLLAAAREREANGTPVSRAATAHRPPSLFPEAPDARPTPTKAPASPPAALPRRVDISDDPD